MGMGRTIQTERAACAKAQSRKMKSMREEGDAKACSETIFYIKVRAVDTSWSLRELNMALKQGAELIYILGEKTPLASGRQID